MLREKLVKIRREGGQSRAVGLVPISRGCRAEEPVSGNPAPDRLSAAKATSTMLNGSPESCRLMGQNLVLTQKQAKQAVKILEIARQHEVDSDVI